MLGQLVLHVLRRDGKLRAWYKAIRRRRGSKVARVAVMRRLATIIWQMVGQPENTKGCVGCSRVDKNGCDSP